MLLFLDAVTGGEVCTDSFKIEKSHDGLIWNIATRRVPVDDSIDVDIGCGNAFGGDAEEEEALDPSTETTLDIIKAHKLEQIQYGKSEYKALMKKYWKDLAGAIKQRVKATKKGPDTAKQEAKQAKETYAAAIEAGKLQDFVKEVLSKFDEYDFYSATKPNAFLDKHAEEEASQQPVQLIIPASYPDGAVTPVFHIISCGLEPKKY